MGGLSESSAQDATPEAQELSRLERFALRYFERRERDLPPAEDDAVHVLDAQERRALRRIETGVVARAALIGAVTAALAALVEIYAEPLLGEDPDQPTTGALIEYWLVVGGAIGVAAVVEIAALYWDSLRSVHALSRAAGLPLFRGRAQAEGTGLALARAALELPNPRTNEGIDAHREVSKLWMVTVGLAYKAKVGVTSFLIKALIRRAAGRATVRAYLVWVGVPVTAFWDAVVAWRVIREARLRAMGPSAAAEIAHALFEGDAPLSEPAQRVALQAVGGCIVSTRDAHPNLMALLHAIEAHVGRPDDLPLDDSDALLRGMEALPTPERLRVLEVMVVAAVLDGRVAREERRLIARAQAACGRTGLGGVHRLRRRFVRGHAFTEEEVENALGDVAR